MTKIEVVTSNIDEIEAVNSSKADRIIFIDDIENGGISPKLHDVKQLLELTSKPVRVIIKNQNIYSVYQDFEVNEMIGYIKELSKLGVEGIIFSSLTIELKIDLITLKRVINAKGNLKLTFGNDLDNIPIHYLEKELVKLKGMNIDGFLTGSKDRAEIISNIFGSKVITATRITAKNNEDYNEEHKYNFYNVLID